MATETFQLDDATTILIDTDPVDSPAGLQPVARGRNQATNFADALDTALPAARVLLEKLQSTAVDAEDIEIEFGLRLSGEVGALIARTIDEANFRVKLRWQPNKTGDG